MSAKRVSYHEGATRDVKSAVAWYQQHSAVAALDFIHELRRATNTIAEAPGRWPAEPNNTRRFPLCDSHLSSFIPKNDLRSRSGR